MPSERAMRTLQEEKLFDIILLMKMNENEKNTEIKRHLRQMYERAQSGMTADEIDAVKERAARALDE